MKTKYRITKRPNDINFLIVRKHWWWPFSWSYVGFAANLIEAEEVIKAARNNFVIKEYSE